MSERGEEVEDEEKGEGSKRKKKEKSITYPNIYNVS